MVANRRRGEDAIPANYKALVTHDQLDGIRKLESFGWTLTYVRRPKFEPVEVVLLHSDGKSYACLNEDGSLDQQTKVRVRGDGPLEEAPTPPDFSEALATVDHETFMPGEPAAPVPPAKPPTNPPAESDSGLAPNAEPIPAASKDTETDSGDKPPPKFLV
jgi:hypothetical protein